jgi:hypothetical protein
MPYHWAKTQCILGVAYLNRLRGERADNLDKAIAAYEAALTVHTREAMPRDHLRTCRWLGQAQLERRDWRAASRAFADARGTFLLLFRELMSRPSLKIPGPRSTL